MAAARLTSKVSRCSQFEYPRRSPASQHRRQSLSLQAQASALTTNRQARNLGNMESVDTTAEPVTSGIVSGEQGSLEAPKVTAPARFYAPTDCHWYLEDGSPFHTVPYKDKKRAGEMRDVTLGDARKVNAWRSVTTICDMISKPALTAWQKNQVLEAVRKLLPVTTGDVEAFVTQVIKDADKIRDESAERGNTLHQAVHDAILGNFVQPKMKPFVEAVRKAMAKKGYDMMEARTEVSFCCNRGYGGTIDLWFPVRAIFDIKTKKEILPKKQLAFDNHAMQLAAYRTATGENCNECYNIFIDEKGKVKIYRWEEKSLNKQLRIFKHLLAASLIKDDREVFKTTKTESRFKL